jgi:hypothetical protein
VRKVEGVYWYDTDEWERTFFCCHDDLTDIVSMCGPEWLPGSNHISVLVEFEGGSVGERVYRPTGCCDVIEESE